MHSIWAGEVASPCRPGRMDCAPYWSCMYEHALVLFCLNWMLKPTEAVQHGWKVARVRTQSGLVESATCQKKEVTSSPKIEWVKNSMPSSTQEMLMKVDKPKAETIVARGTSLPPSGCNMNIPHNITFVTGWIGSFDTICSVVRRAVLSEDVPIKSMTMSM